MFERFNESARRVIFFARYEASQFGSTTIETEHLLLGLVKENWKVIELLSPETNLVDTIRTEVENHVTKREKTSTSIDLPLSNECKRILAYSMEEAEQLQHSVITSGHLLLGVLREENCFAAKLLSKLGVGLKSSRAELARAGVSERENAEGMKTRRESVREVMDALQGSFPWQGISIPEAGFVPDAGTAQKIAEAAWHPRFCKAESDRVAAGNADLRHGVWIVTAPHSSGDSQSTLSAFIQKSDGKILRLHQEKAEA